MIRNMSKLFASLLMVGVVLGAGAPDFRPGKISTLKLRNLSDENVTKLDGYADVRGKLEAVWEVGEDGATPEYPRYDLLLDAASAAAFPTLGEESVRLIHILNGPETLKRAAGPAAAEAFESRATVRVTIEGSFRLTQIGMGFECGQLHVGAQVDAV